MRTEPSDIMLGAMTHTLSRVFPDSSIPEVFVVKTMAGIQLIQNSPAPDSTVLMEIRQAKELRKGKQKTTEDSQITDKVDFLFTFYERSEFSQHVAYEEQIAPLAALRQAVVEIEARVQDGQIFITFSFNRYLKHRPLLQEWMKTYLRTVSSAAQDLLHMPLTISPSDFPLLDISTTGIDMLIREVLPNMQLGPEDIVDICPCSPLQEGVLLSSSSYADYRVWRCIPSDKKAISPSRLQSAWKAAVSQHRIFSTIFGLHPEGNSYVQFILNNVEIQVSQITSAGCPATTLADLPRPQFTAYRPKHAFTICQSDTGDVACRFDVCHTLYDSYSMNILLQDTLDFYNGKAPLAAQPFSDVVRYIKNRPKLETNGFWIGFLSGIIPCKFPVLQSPADAGMQDVNSSIFLPAESLADITGFCKRNGITRSIFMHVAWALVLSHYTGTEDVCFGYMASGRDAPVDGINRIVGPLANMVVNRIDLRKSLRELFESTAAALKEHRKHQQTSLAEVQHAMGVSDGLFNTMVSLLRTNPFGEGKKEGFSFKKHCLVSPHEFDLVLEGYLDPDTVSVTMYYRTAFVSHQVAQEVCTMFTRAANYLVSTETWFQKQDLASTQQSIKAEDNNHRPIEHLPEQFFKHIVGKDRTSTEAFWRNEFPGLVSSRTHCSRTEATSRPRSDDVELTIDGIQWGGSNNAETVIRAVWSVMVAQMSESTDTLFGVNLMGRQAALPSIKSLQGTNSSLVPFRLQVNWAASAQEFLRTVHGKEEDIAVFHGAGLHWLRQLGKEAMAACDFPSLLIIEHASEDMDVAKSNEDVKNQQAYESYDIVVHCCVQPDRLHLRISFDSEQTARIRGPRIASQFEHILRQFTNTRRRDNRLAHIASIGEKDLEDVWKWNTTVPKPVDVSVIDLFKAEAISHPESIAVHAWDGDLTYEQLDALSTKLARQLIAKGIGPGTVVPLCFEKSKWMSVAMLGTVKTGAAGTGIDPAQPEKRLHSIMIQVGASLVLSSTKNVGLVRRIGKCEVLGVDENTFSKHTLQQNSELPNIDPSQNLYIVFTSGSTGIPKGVVISHRNYSTAVLHQHESYGFKPGSRVFDFSSYAFDAAWYNLLHTLTSGGCLCVPSDEERQSDLESCFGKYDVTVAFLTPSIARHIRAKALGRLATLMLGGEAVLPSDLSLSSDNTQVKIIYGPSECTPMTTCYDLCASRQIALGHGVGACTWVVNPDDENLLTPIGMVGELWLEGPLVGQGYLNDPEKTSSAFIEDPEWLLRGSSKRPGRQGRLYRTGDLVRYENDGALVFVRRKDTQVKIRGQRVELSEVEQHICRALEAVKDSAGNWQVVAETIRSDDTDNLILIAFISPANSNMMSEDQCVKLVKEATSGLSSRLAESVPAYMVPNAYIAMQSFPMTITGKTDRVRLRTLGNAQWKQHCGLEGDAECSTASNSMEALLQEIWMTVLNLPTEVVSINKPFTRLGGDSITAMQVVSKCRAHGISLTVGDVLRASTIQKLALLCNQSVSQNTLLAQEYNEKETGEPFGLSPIQNKFFDIFPVGIDFFNQSFVLDLNRSVLTTTLHNALKALVTRHSMLRARYRQNANGKWEQFIAEDNLTCFAFANHNVARRSDVLQLAQARQAKLDILEGPVFAADLFNIAEIGQMLVLSAHHLVVDLVSWRIIWNDVEEYIKSGKLRPQAPPHFRTWCRLQRDAAKCLKADEVLAFDVPKADLAFWGVEMVDNINGVSEDCVAVLGAVSTNLLLGKSNDSLRTETLDIILGAYAYSFYQAFPEHKMPAIFIEGHGREQSTSLPIDVSGTVGWFTTVHPLLIEMSSKSTIVDAVRIAKDTRRGIPGKGQPYFSSRYHNPTCQQKFQHHDHIELLLNFAGRYQQLESSDGLFKLAEPFDGGHRLEVVSQSSMRLALIEANIAVQGGRLVTTFTLNRNMKHQARLRQWFQDFNQTIDLALQALTQTAPSLTMSDLPLMPISYRGLDRLLKQQLPGMGVEAGNVIDMYPTLPMQEGILLSSGTGSSSYATFWIWTCTPSDSTQSISPSRLEEAWRLVVDRHDILSTIFGLHPEGSNFVQILLDGPKIRSSHQVIDTGNLTEDLYNIDRPTFAASEPQHSFTVLQSQTGEVACRLDINHTLLDGASLTPLLHDLATAYDGLQLRPAPYFKEMVQYVGSIDRAKRIEFWSRFLDDIDLCEVATCYTPEPGFADTFRYIHVPSTSVAGISSFCKDMGITRAVFLQIAWAMVISQLTGMEDVCFGYLASGRDAPVDHINRMVGPLANMLISRINLGQPLATVLGAASADSIGRLDYQHVSLAEIQHEIGCTGRRLFNTAMTVREEDGFEQCDNRSILFKLRTYQDPHEYDLLLSSRLVKDSMTVSVQIREATISSQFAEEVAATLTKAIDTLLSTNQCSSHDAGDDDNGDSFGTESLHDEFFHRVTGHDRITTMAFWKQQFTDLDAAYFRHSRGVGPSRQSRQRGELALSAEALEFRECDITIPTIVQAAWSIVAARNAGSSDALFGISLSQSVLPIRIGINWESNTHSFLKQVQGQMGDLALFEQTCLYLVRQASDEAAMACKFRTVLVFENVDGPAEGTLQNLEVYGIVILCRPANDGMKILIRFDHDVVSKSGMSRIASQFEHTLRCLSDFASMDKKLTDAVSVSPSDLQTIWGWNATVPGAIESCVHKLIHQRVQAHPDAPAICAWDGELTYGQLDRLSIILACRLTSIGIGPGKVVPLCFEKSMWAAVAMLAVMRTGAASTAMDTTQPEGRLRLIVSQLSGKLVLCSNANEKLARRLGADDTVVVSHEHLSEYEAGKTDEDLPASSPSDVLYVVFTSGSTGTPKGTMITHQNFSSIITYQRDALGLSSASRVYDFASYAFDIAWCNFLHALTCGGCLCIPSETDRRNNIEGSITALRANYAHITPTVLRCLNWSKLNVIEVLNLSGEAVLPGDIAFVPRGVKVVNAYGPAETNVVTVHDLTASTQLEDISIGRGAGACTWVVDVDHANSLVPIGAVGELWIEGPLVGKGYINDKEKTLKAFVEDPGWLWRGTEGHEGRRGTLYRTGDLVRYNEDGTLVYIGRKDTQVKIRGQRIELGEVEQNVYAALKVTSIGGVNVVAEAVQPQQADGMMLVVFISLLGSDDMTEDDYSIAVKSATAGLSERLSDSLPAYMIPSVYLPIREIPRTTTGKTNRRELRETITSKTMEEIVALGRSNDSIQQPETDMETAMQKLWADVLNIRQESIGVEDSFFRIGGDSIGAMKLVSLARDQDIAFTVRDVFQHPVLHRLSSVAVSQLPDQGRTIPSLSLLNNGSHIIEDVLDVVSSPLNFGKDKILDVVPCSPLQEHLMGREACKPLRLSSAHSMEIHKDIDLNKFQDAWNQVVSRNAILRTRIIHIQGHDWVQVVMEDTVEWIHCETLEDYREHSERNPMGPGTRLVRFGIAEPSGGGCRHFIWELHWAVYDGWALRLMLAEAEKIYFNKRVYPLENTLAFIKHIKSIDDEHVNSFWKNQFSNLESCHFPVPKEATLQYENAHLSVQDVDRNLGDFTIATIIRAALSIVIARSLNSTEAIFGTTVTGRQCAVAGIERMAGPAFATLPICVSINWETSVKDLLEAVQKQATDMIPFEQTSLEKIRQISPEAARACDFQTLLVIQSAIRRGDPRYRDESGGMFVRGLVAGKETILELGRRTGSYSLYVECQLGEFHDGRIDLRACFDSSVVELQQMEHFLDELSTAVRCLSDSSWREEKLKDVVLSKSTPICNGQRV